MSDNGLSLAQLLFCLGQQRRHRLLQSANMKRHPLNHLRPVPFVIAKKGLAELNAAGLAILVATVPRELGTEGFLQRVLLVMEVVEQALVLLNARSREVQLNAGLVASEDQAVVAPGQATACA